MKILLLGEYSNVHNTLAQGLRLRGHQVTVVSNGDFWKNYPRDIDVSRRTGKMGGVMLMAKILALLPRLKDYDVVQLINPMFFELKAERLFHIYKYLRRHNRRFFLGAFGMDYYWVHECDTRKPLKYSDFNIGNDLRCDKEAMRYRKDWLNTPKGELNKFIANDCDGIIAGLYEYMVCYHPLFPSKTTFIPYPMKLSQARIKETSFPIKIFIGISKGRSAYKGTDMMLEAAQTLHKKYRHKTEIIVTEGVPFDKYQHIMDGCDILLDQLYAYSPAMNALLAMSKGIIIVGGGEEGPYKLLEENELRPIINVQPNKYSVYHELEKLILHPECIDGLKRQSMEFVRRHHDYLKVAAQYEQFYTLFT